MQSSELTLESNRLIKKTNMEKKTVDEERRIHQVGIEKFDECDYMNDEQLSYFKRKLLAWRHELEDESKSTLDELRNESYKDVGDEADHATLESNHSLELRTRDRYRKLIHKVDKALKRIEDGSYGYCEETGEEIGLRRLDARPIATLSLEAQERHELRERQVGIA